MPRRSSAGSRSRTERPSSRMSPLVSSIIRLTRRIAVVLPQPDGPTRTQMRPAGTSKERSWIAGSLAPGVALLDVVEDQRRGLRVGRLPLVVGGVLGDQGEAPARRAGEAGDPTRSDPGRLPRAGVRGVLQAVVERRPAARPGPARSPRASRRTTRSSAAAGRGGRCRSRGRAGRPRSPTTRCCRGPSGRGRAAARRDRGGCGRRGSRSRRGRAAGRAPGARPRWRRCRSGAGRPRGRCAGRRAPTPGSSSSPRT